MFHRFIPLVLTGLLGYLTSCATPDRRDPVPEPPSPAHLRSKPFVIDPAYSATAVVPASPVGNGGTTWMYGDGQIEAWKIHALVSEGFAVNKHVGYERNYGKVAVKNSFHHAGAAGNLVIRATGALRILANAQEVLTGPSTVESQSIPLPAGLTEVVVEVTPPAGEPAGILVENGPYRTDTGWTWRSDAAAWSPAVPFPQLISHAPPHQLQEPTMTRLPVTQDGEISDFGAVVLGRPVFRCTGTPEVGSGESREEALASAADSETHHTLTQLPDGRWTTVHALGFRFLRITGGTPTDLTAEVLTHPVHYAGAFACSDDRLTNIWMHSALTLRTCMHRLMLDGAKRDRMPWIGDQASNLYANAFVFADADIIRQSFTALGRPTKGYINGIVDYSLWWVINHAMYQRYFDDAAYLAREIPHIEEMLAHLAAQSDADGLLRPDPKGWIFIDWGVKVDKKRPLTALQILWWWAQASGARLAEKSGDSAMAARWHQRAEALEVVLQAQGWDAQAGAFREYLDGPGTGSPYPDILAVLSGLARPDQHAGIRAHVQAKPCMGTPFMRGFEAMALAEIGDDAGALTRVTSYWGGMLDAGATTFWEDYRPGETSHTAMYKRPFSRSQCHAWASGPVAILPMTLLGIRCQGDGWREFTVAPHLGRLTWACATVPTPHGAIIVSAEATQMTITVPAGTTLIQRDIRHPGPVTVTLSTTP